MKALIPALASLALLPQAAGAAGDIPHTSSAVSYLCAGGAILQVAYLNLGNGQSFATLAWGGRLVPMHLWPAASGARYIADDEQNSLRWHTKGDEGRLSFLAADHEAEETEVLTLCRSLGPPG